MINRKGWMKKRERICMECEKPVRWWHRKWRLFLFDYCVWHWKCSAKEREYRKKLAPILL